MPDKERKPCKDNSREEELWEAGSRNYRAMKRCFMTGKQCIFSSNKRSGKKVFVIMPFSPNLETFYRWSLKPYLTTKIGYNLEEMQVQRADEVHDIGYIVCEKICRKIQESDLVLAEISLKNQNVFYEIGLAYGLERPIIFMRNADVKEDVFKDPCLKQSINLTSDTSSDLKILEYPNVKALSYDMDKFQLHRYISMPWKDRIKDGERLPRELKISALKINQGQPPRQASQYISNEKSSPDIDLDFDAVLSGAVSVAMAEIKSDSVSEQYKGEPWAKAVDGIKDKKTDDTQQIDDTLWKDFSTLRQIEVDGTRSYNDIANSIESSFCTLIDVSGDNRESSTAYFWLGFCHARGINAIPVHRGKLNKKDLNLDSEIFKEPRLAFDIRSLWYAQYDESKPYELKVKIREILERLFERDLPNRQKRAFWDRFSREKKLKIFTGAIHNSDLNREMVGDWDVRAVSELFAYLSSAQETMGIELVTPFYSPDTSFKGSIEYILSALSLLNDELSSGEIEDIKKEITSKIETAFNSMTAADVSSNAKNESTENIKDAKLESEDIRQNPELEIEHAITSAIQHAIRSKAEEYLKNAKQDPKAASLSLIKFAIESAIDAIVKLQGDSKPAIKDSIQSQIKQIIRIAAIESEKIIFIDNFCRDIDENLSDSNAIIIASPDVNPVAEYVLNRIYGVMKSDLHGEKQAFIFDEESTYTGYKVFKEIEPPLEIDEQPQGYVFSWAKIPGNDDERLKEFLIKRYHIYWVCTEKFDKSEDGKTIEISKGDKTHSLTLNNYKSEVILKIDNNETDKFIAKEENGELNVYPQGNARIASDEGIKKIIKYTDVDVDKHYENINMNVDRHNEEEYIETIPREKMFHSEFYIEAYRKEKKLFSWDKISSKGKDNGRLIKFLTQKFGINWTKNAGIEKIDNGKTIKIFAEKKLLLLKLMDDGTEVILEIKDGEPNKLAAKMEDNELNIYEKRDPNEPLKRGFIWHASINNVIYSDLVKDYFPQNSSKGNSFDLLGQLVVARYNPANKMSGSKDSTRGKKDLCGDDNNNNQLTLEEKEDKIGREPSLIVLLNGVSGPATFALAQILTGGVLNAKPRMNSNSEKMLELINDLLDQNPEGSIEGIVKVKIKRSNKGKSAPSYSQMHGDTREVRCWCFIKGPKLIKKCHVN